MGSLNNDTSFLRQTEATTAVPSFPFDNTGTVVIVTPQKQIQFGNYLQISLLAMQVAGTFASTLTVFANQKLEPSDNTPLFDALKQFGESKSD